jgi:hypothetical protein
MHERKTRLRQEWSSHVSDRRWRTAILAAVVLVFVGIAHADSDGFYCMGKGYIAYDLRSFKNPGLSAPHVLRVVWFGNGIRPGNQVGMQDFQVHELRCEADRVEIAGYNKNWLKYVIDIRQPDAPHITERIEEPAKKHPVSKETEPDPRQLGYEQPGKKELESVGSEHKYQLLFARSNKPAAPGPSPFGGIDYIVSAELQEIDAQGNVSQRLLLYEEHSVEYLKAPAEVQVDERRDLALNSL